MPVQPRRFGLACLLGAAAIFAYVYGDEARTVMPAGRWKQHAIRRPKPPVVEPAQSPVASKPPNDAVILFDGSNLDAWQSEKGGPAKWTVADGAMQTVPGSGPIETKAKFGDIQLHVEWAAPKPPHGVGQNRGNSGVFLMDQFEIQVLDSYQADTYADGQAGAIYGQYPPLFNASRPPGEWQAYDIAFRRPRFDSAGKLLEPARITVFYNGILVQNNEEPFGPTSWLKWLPYTDHGARGALSLQDHDHPVRYRNIWLRALPERPCPPPREAAPAKPLTVSTQILDEYTGQYLLNTKSDARKAVVTRAGGHLVIKFPNRPFTLVLEPVSETVFDMQFTDGRLTFHRDDNGRVNGVHLRIGDGERDMKKAAP